MTKRLVPSILLGIVLLIASCLKHNGSDSGIPEKDLISEAKNFYIFDVSITEAKGAALTGSNHHYIQKAPDWDRATVEKLNSINTVVVPICYLDTALTVKTINGNTKTPLGKLSYLLVYRDPKSNNQLTSEVMYTIPDASSTPNSFSGTSIIEKWDGTILRGYKYSNGEVSSMAVEIGDKATLAKQSTVCETTDWYICVTVGSSQEYCTYKNTTTHCIQIDDGPSSPTSSPSDPGGGTPPVPGTDPRVNVPGGTRPVRVPIEPVGPMDICKQSFVFKKVVALDQKGFGGWQVAPVTGMHLTLLDSKGRAMVVIPGPIIYIGLPIVRKNGEFYSTDRAAQIAVDIDNAAIRTLMDYYHKTVAPDVLGLNAAYRKALNTEAEKYGGKATLDPGIGNELPTLKPTVASYYDCN
jgi:hypothetical protein